MSLFPPPETIPMQEFTRLPQEFRKRRLTAWSAINRQGREIHSFLEGPCFDYQGNLYVVDIPNGRVFRVDREGNWALAAEYDGEPNGLKVRGDGQVFIADYKNGLMQLDPLSGRVTPYCTRYRLERFLGVNDLIFHSSGDLYFTDQGQSGLQCPNGRVFRLSANGERLQLLMDGIPSPNGLAFSPDESVLYVNVTRANAVWRLPLMPDGGVSKAGVFLQLSGGTGPDGLAVDQSGALAVCHVGLGAVWRFSATGEPLQRYQSPGALWTTNLAYGGPRGKTLFITESESGQILQAETPCAGIVLHGQR